MAVHSASAKSASASAASRKRKAEDAPLQQTYIDLGQKSFARVIECPVCGLAYTHGEEADEAAHKRYHRRALQGVRVRGALATLHIIDGERPDGTRLVGLSEGDGAEARRKLVEAAALLDPEHGAKEVPEGFRAALCLEATTGRVRGLAIAEPLSRAFRVVPPPPEVDGGDSADGAGTTGNVDVSDSGVLSHDGQPCDAVCGISHVWVEPQHRRRGIARELLDAVRQRFAAGFELPREQMAFSGPTASGRRLAVAFAGTEGFLVYD